MLDMVRRDRAAMKALILCAGYGTRLGDYTREIPKPMLPLCGRPLLEYSIGYLRHHGFREIAINLHFRPDAIVDHFGDGAGFGVEIHYSFEEELRGTAGAIRQLGSYLTDEESFLVMYGDLLLDQDLASFLRFHSDRQAAATLLLHKRGNSNSIVRMAADHQITGFLERPSPEERGRLPDSECWANSGLQVLSRRVVSYIPDTPTSDLPRDIYQRYHTHETILGYPLSGFRCAIDSPERYAAAEAAVRDGRYRYCHGRRQERQPTKAGNCQESWEQ